MTADRMSQWLGIALAALVVAGCGTSAPARFYTLASTATADANPPARYGVLVGPVSVPASVDRQEFVVQVAPNRVDIDEFNRWAAPLHDSIARTIAGDLSELLQTPDVAVAPFANFDPVYRVTIDVQRFESVPGDSVRIDAVWVVRRAAGGRPSAGRTSWKEAVTGKDYEALAAAHSRALAKVSADIAAEIRRDADRREGAPPGAGAK